MIDIPAGAKPYDLVLTAVVPNGTNGQIIEARVDDADFVAVAREVGAYLSASGGGALAGTRLVDTPSPTLASNTHAPLGGVTARFQIGDEYISNAEAPIGMMGGTSEKDGYMPAPFLLGQRETARAYVSNNSGSNIRVTFVFRGYKLRRSA